MRPGFPVPAQSLQLAWSPWAQSRTPFPAFLPQPQAQCWGESCTQDCKGGGERRRGPFSKPQAWAQLSSQTEVKFQPALHSRHWDPRKCCLYLKKEASFTNPHKGPCGEADTQHEKAQVCQSVAQESKSRMVFCLGNPQHQAPSSSGPPPGTCSLPRA